MSSTRAPLDGLTMWKITEKIKAANRNGTHGLEIIFDGFNTKTIEINQTKTNNLHSKEEEEKQVAKRKEEECVYSSIVNKIKTGIYAGVDTFTVTVHQGNVTVKQHKKRRSPSPSPVKETKPNKKPKVEPALSKEECDKHNEPYLVSVSETHGPAHTQDYSDLKYYEGMPVTMHKGVYGYSSSKAYTLKQIVKPTKEIIIGNDNALSEETWVYISKSKVWRRKGEKKETGRNCHNDTITFCRAINFVAEWMKDPR